MAAPSKQHIAARKKRTLIFPNTNTLSHLTQAFAIAEWLDQRGYETHLGFSSLRQEWAAPFGSRCHSIKELWELSGMPFPCIGWFSDPAHIEACVASQEQLIQEIQPDIVIGIFDFVARVAVGQRPYLSINGACMLPTYKGVLGFDDHETFERAQYRKLMISFWRFAAHALKETLAKRRRSPVHQANELLVGDLNLIYEIGAICGYEDLPARHHFIGPIVWRRWEDIAASPPWTMSKTKLTVYVNTGTLGSKNGTAKWLKDHLLSKNIRVLVSSGINGSSETSEQVFCRPFLAPAKATKLADLVICSGGVGSCYNNIFHGTPSLIWPRHPEQATNGLNLERIGCGRTLTRNVAFQGNTEEYEQSGDPHQAEEWIHDLLQNGHDRSRLESIQMLLQQCDTEEKICQFVEQLL
jgi:UDP:flavonoid glycosyltransferase YjiC (YdhE family)